MEQGHQGVLPSVCIQEGERRKRWPWGRRTRRDTASSGNTATSADPSPGAALEPAPAATAANRRAGCTGNDAQATTPYWYGPASNEPCTSSSTNVKLDFFAINFSFLSFSLNTLKYKLPLNDHPKLTENLFFVILESMEELLLTGLSSFSTLVDAFPVPSPSKD